jgi:methyl-accepting chemotaxis protein
MLFGDLSSGGLLIDLAIVVVVFGILLFEIAAQLKTKKKMAELEQKIVTLEQFQSEISASIDQKVTILKEMLLEKTNPLTNKLNELTQKANAMHERGEAIRREFEQKVEPLRSSVDDTAAKFSSSHDAIRKIVQEGKSEIDRMTKDIDAFAEEIQKMKDFIRERTIDLEL